MPLNWDASKVKYFDENKDELWVTYNQGTREQYEDVNAETKSLIFGSMSVGIGSIKISNAGDFYARWKILEKYDHLSVYCWFDENNEKHYQYLTPEIVKKHINLSTNVGEEKKTAWIERIFKYLHKDNQDLTVKELTKFYNSKVQEFEDSF